MTPRMSFCIKAVKELDDGDLDQLTNSIEEYTGLGLNSVEAQRKALMDLEDSLADERVKAIASIKKAAPDLFGQAPTVLKAGEGVEGSMSAEEVEQAVQEALAGVPSAPIVEVVESAEALGLDAPAGSVPKGWTDPDGRISVARKYATSPLDVQRTVFHELLHRGVKVMVDGNPAYLKAMADIRNSVEYVGNMALAWQRSPDGVAKRAEFAQGGPLLGRDLDNYEALSVEEALATLAEGLAEGSIQRPRGLVSRLANALARVADSWGMTKLAEAVRSMGYDAAEKFVVEAVRRSGGPLRAPGAQYSTRVFRSELSEASRQAMAASFSKVPGAGSKIGQWVQDAMLNAKESPLLLRFMTNDQIAESFKLPALDRMMSALGRMGSTANRSMERAAEVTKLWRALGDKTGVDVSNVMLRSTLAQAHVSIKENGRYLGLDEAWNHISNSHLNVSGMPAEKEAFAKLYREWAALPAPAKKVYDSVRDDLSTQREEQRKAFFKQAADLYGPALSRVLSRDELEILADSTGSIQDAVKDLLGVAGTKAEQKAMAGLRDSLRDVNSTFRQVKGPYFPLVRFGDHVVVVKSAAVTDLEQESQLTKENLQRMVDGQVDVADADIEDYEARTKTARDAYAKARDKLDKLKQSEKDYTVRFYESPAQAENARAELQRQNPEAKVYRTKREEYQRGISGASPAFIKRLEEAMSSAMDSGGQVDAAAKSNAMKAMRDLWLQQSPERSALRSELSRRGVDGVKVDQMLSGYAQHSRGSAWRTSRLAYQSELTSSLLALGQNRESAEAMAVLNEMKKRVLSDMQAPNDSQFLQSVSNLSYFWQLGLNPSYFITNATQSWLTSLPFMGGRHGYGQARRELADASKSVIALLKQASAESIRENGVLVGVQLRMTDDLLRRAARNEAEYQMLKELTEDGVVDITAKHDLGMVADGTNRTPLVSHIFEMSGVLANYPELYNRLSTALAAHRLEVKRASETSNNASEVQAQATDYARRVLNRTHFNYSQENAPSIMRGPVARLLFQFKRYQQGMVYLYVKLASDAFGKNLQEPDPQRRAEIQRDARRALAYTLGSTLATSGLAGLPIAAPVALVAAAMSAAWPDDDEPEIIQMAYNGMKDVLGETAGQVVGKGALSAIGLDLSGKIGQGSILNPVAFADTDGKDMLSKDWWVAAGVAMAGPAASTWLKLMDGAGMVADGEVQRGLERMLPVAAANLAKSFRVADEGEVSRRGDVLMTPEEFSAFDIGAKALGFALVDSADMYEGRAAFDRAVRERKEARSRLLREVAQGGDGAVEDVAEYNSRNPDFPITAKSIQQYLQERQKARQELRDGMRVGKRDVGIYDELN